MKSKPTSIKTYLFISFFVLLFSCGSVTEEIYLNEDGSGTYTMYTDMIGSTRTMMTEMMKGIYPDLDEDSLTRLVEENIWKDYPDEIDSLIDFSTQLPDSLKEDPEKMKIIAATQVFMKGSKAEKYLNIGAKFEFKSLQELEDFQDIMADNQDSSSGGGGQGFDAPKMKVSYSFDGKTFTRTSTLVDEAANMTDSTLAMLNVMLGESTSKTIVYLPGKVKQASKDQLVSSEGKKVVYEYSLIKSVTGEQSTDFKIEMK